MPFGAGLGQREAQRGVWGRRKSPTAKKVAEPLPVQPCGCFGWSISVRLRRGKQRRLRCLCQSAGAVCLVTFAGKAVSVESVFDYQGKSAWYETKFVLGNWQAAGAFCSH